MTQNRVCPPTHHIHKFKFKIPVRNRPVTFNVALGLPVPQGLISPKILTELWVKSKGIKEIQTAAALVYMQNQ